MMNIILFENHELGQPLHPQDKRTIHLLKVLHKRPGDPFDAGLLGGSRGTGFISRITEDGSVICTLDLHELPPPRIPIRIAVGFPRPIQLKRLLRDLANLGVEGVDLVGTELGEKSYRDTKLFLNGGAKTAFIEGAVQARDTRIPGLSVYPTLGQWLKTGPWDAQARLVAADNVRPQGALSRLSPVQGCLVLAVGAERGWSDRERDMLEHSGFQRLSMGNRALRTETACIGAVILGMEKIGELG
ncbi:MAG: 16S rRNA (uracil(1498)-N(3))-methyltransferase [Treponema sp.]|jgi:RsmE family RNA methyltransferase|nr:16S rRNA (uracil(1498)-N(3))-methyltransferase [Treponema sp.]